MTAVTSQIVALFHKSGHSNYGREAVTQLQHALQAAWLAEQSQAADALVAAALLHDLGHLLHELPEDAPERGIDDRHEDLAATWLAARFVPATVDPVRWHVRAKRYLCTVDAGYLQTLSGPSIQSLHLQGGLMSEEERRDFEAEPHFAASIALRRWDDQAKVRDLVTPPIEHFIPHLNAAQLPTAA